MSTRPAFMEQFANESLLSILQKIVRMIDRTAPRLDEVGKHNIAKLADKADMNVPEQDMNYLINTASEKVSDKLVTLFGHSPEDNILLKGAALGLTAGVGAVLLPGHHQMFEVGNTDNTKNKLLTIGVYILGGIAASYISKQLNKQNNTLTIN